MKIHNCSKCNRLSVLGPEDFGCPLCEDEFALWFRKIVTRMSTVLGIPVRLLLEEFDG